MKDTALQEGVVFLGETKQKKRSHEIVASLSIYTILFSQLQASLFQNPFLKRIPGTR